MIELEHEPYPELMDPGTILQDFSPPDPEDCPQSLEEQQATQEPPTSQGETI